MIPKILHRIWLGSPMPDHLAAYGDTWAQHHPGWEQVLWTEENMPALFNQRIFDAAEQVAPGHEGQLRSDVARYELLAEHGGVYIDCDLECLRPIDPLLEDVECFAGWELPGRWVNNAILGATPSHPFLADLIAGLPKNVRRQRGNRPNKLTGPQYLTPVYRRHAKTVTVYPQEFFYGFLWSDIGTERDGYRHPDAYALHWWENKRRKLAAAS